MEVAPMYKNILIATDGSELAGRGVEHGLALAKAVGASVTVVMVTGMWSAMEMAHEARIGHADAMRSFEESAAAAAKSKLDAVAQKAKEKAVACQCVHVPDQTPAEGIIKVAETNHCDLIVMASHGRRTVGRLLLGSQVSEVLAHTKIPTLVVR
jgi:nucleotide-binding universal stress UspA family protein